MNISNKMRELIPILKSGINGIGCPEVRPQCEENWDENYAIVKNFYWDTPLYDDYFDYDAFRLDSEKIIKNHFSESGSETALVTKQPNDSVFNKNTIVVVIYYHSQEIEVYKVDDKSK